MPRRRNAAAAVAAADSTIGDEHGSRISQSAFRESDDKSKRRSWRRSTITISVVSSAMTVTIITYLCLHWHTKYHGLGHLRNSRFLSSDGGRSSVITPPLHPEGMVINGVEVFYMLPQSKSMEDVKGIVLYLHGCSQGGADAFLLPEDRIVIKMALMEGLAILSPTSQDRTTGCWKLDTDDVDANRLFRDTGTNGSTLMDQWMQMVEIDRQSVSIFAIGNGSGANFLLNCWPFVQFDAMVLFGANRNFQNRDLEQATVPPPIAFVVRSRDSVASEAADVNSDSLISSRVRTIVISIEPVNFAPARCNERLPELGDRRCDSLLNNFRSQEYSNLMSENYQVLRNTWGGEWISALASLDTNPSQKDNADEDSLGKVPKRSLKGKSRLHSAVEEEINTAYGVYPVVADRMEDVFQWLKEIAKL